MVRDQIALSVSCFDRLYLNGYVPTLHSSGQLVRVCRKHLGKVSFDVVWLKDEAQADSARLPEPTSSPRKSSRTYEQHSNTARSSRQPRAGGLTQAKREVVLPYGRSRSVRPARAAQNTGTVCWER